MSLLERFPSKYKPRDIQKDILKELDEKIKSGYKKIILCAPTGVGKSLIGATLAYHFGSSFIVTSSKHLQDQYTNDLNLVSVKGKANFPCLKLMDDDNIQDEAQAMKYNLVCTKGPCEVKVTKDGKEIKEICKYKPVILDIDEGKQSTPSCSYYLQKYNGLLANHAVWNYYSYFQIMKYNYKVFQKYLDKKISIFDEAHKIEDQIIQFIGCDIYKGPLEECKINTDDYILNDIDSMVKLLDDMSEFYAREIKGIKESRQFQINPDYDAIASLDRKYERVANARVDIVSDKENFIINEPEKDFAGNFKALSIKPLSIAKFTNQLFKSEYQIFMSATIDKQSFCENTGLSLEDTAIIDTPKSPFPPQNRSIEFLDIARLSYNATHDDELKVIQTINEIMNQHKNQRGLILTSSKSRCFKILENLSRENKARIRICHSVNQGDKTQDQILQEHEMDPQGVLLSSSLWEGIDLKEDLSRFQIIAKVPYPNFTEKRVKIKMNKYRLWYTSLTLRKLLQGCGRSIRSEKDWAVTYILDTAVKNLLFKAQEIIPKSYHDVLKVDEI